MSSYGHIRDLKKKEISIFYILFLNLCITVLGVLLNIDTVDIAFGIKYIIRNIVLVIATLGFLTSDIDLSRKEIDKLFEFFTVLQLFSFVLVLMTGIHIYMCTILTKTAIINTGQYVKLGGILIPRFSGTCSEAGYLAPLFVITTYYYLKQYICLTSAKEKRKALYFLIAIMVMTIFTFSTACYGFVAVVAVVTYLKNSKRKSSVTILLIFGGIVFLVVLILIGNNEIREFFYENFINKVTFYFSGSTSSSYMNWSAMDRTQHITYAVKLIKKSSLEQIFLGRGTGAYSYLANKNSKLLVTGVEEAYNLFLSTLIDRGLIGFGCLFALLFYCYKNWVRNDIYSTALFIGILSQFAHWMITGNFWLYYFWYEVLFLLGYKRWIIGVKREKQKLNN